MGLDKRQTRNGHARRTTRSRMGLGQRGKRSSRTSRRRRLRRREVHKKSWQPASVRASRTGCPRKKQFGDCHRCALARLTLGEVRQTAAAKNIFEEVKASCIKCSGSVREVLKCHCAENFEWKLRFITKTEKKLQGLQFLLH